MRLIPALALLTWLGAATAHATPATLSFTGQLSTASGPVDGPVNITFTILNAETGGAQLWSDTVAITADLGRVVAILGRPASNPINDTVFTGEARFLEIKVQDETLSPRLTISAVPYAIQSASTSDPTVQRRPSGPNQMSCPAGQFIRAIDEHGHVTCAPAYSCYEDIRYTNESAFELRCRTGYFALRGGCWPNAPVPLLSTLSSADGSGWYCGISGTGGVNVKVTCCAGNLY